MHWSKGSSSARTKRVGRRIVILPIGLLVVLALAGVATAVRLQTGDAVLRFDARISPRRLPSTSPTPVSIQVVARVSTTDSNGSPALSRLRVKFDRDISFSTADLPVCKIGRILAEDTKSALRICRRALVGTGSMGIEITFSDAPRQKAQGRVLVFNAGTRHNVTTLLTHTFLPNPIPSVIVTTAKLRHIRGASYGSLATVTLPKIAGGAGAITSFNLKLGRRYSFRGERRSFVSGVCSHHRLGVQVAGYFSHGAVARGSLAHGCASR